MGGVHDDESELTAVSRCTLAVGGVHDDESELTPVSRHPLVLGSVLHAVERPGEVRGSHQGAHDDRAQHHRASGRRDLTSDLQHPPLLLHAARSGHAAEKDQGNGGGRSVGGSEEGGGGNLAVAFVCLTDFSIMYLSP